MQTHQNAKFKAQKIYTHNTRESQNQGCLYLFCELTHTQSEVTATVFAAAYSQRFHEE